MNRLEIIQEVFGHVEFKQDFLMKLMKTIYLGEQEVYKKLPIEMSPVGCMVNFSYPESDRPNEKYLTAQITELDRCNVGDKLYLAPQPKREPLSTEKAIHILSQLPDDATGLDIIRAIEKAHGIGVE